jgi:tetratricopeptide (TPR) repeat protein
MRSQHRQFLERVRIIPYQKIIRKNIYDLIEDINNSTNSSSLKILKSMIEDPSVRISENEIYDLLEELTYLQEPYEHTRDNLLEFETRISVISSVLEYIIFNIEMFHLGAGFYEVISNQLEDSVLSYRNCSSNVSWATSLNHYIPKEETIHKYNLEFLLEYIFSILKILRDNELQFRKVNLHVDHFLKVLVKSFEHTGKKGPSSFPSLKQSWESLRNTCNFGDSVSPFFTDYYLLKKIQSIIQNWSYEGDKKMISKYGKWLLMEFMWMHADNIWIEEIKYDRKKSSCNDEILTQIQLKSIIFLFGILNMIENYIIESKHLPTLALTYYFAKDFLQKTKSAPIQIKSTVILLKLYFKDGNTFKIIDQDFERYFQDLSKEDTEAVSHFKSFLSDIKPKLYQESISNYDNTIFDNIQGTILLPQTRINLSSKNNYDEFLNKNLIEIIADEMTCSVTLEPSDSLCILGCEHTISYDTFLNLSIMSRFRCPQCRQNIKDNECTFLPQHNIFSYFYFHFVSSELVGTPPILSIKATRPHYFSSPLISFGSLTTSTCIEPVYIQPESLSNQRLNFHNDLSKIRWPLKVSKKLQPAHNEAIKALNNKKYEETVLWLTCLLQQYPNSFSTRCDRAFVNSFLLNKPYLALEDLNIALGLKTKSSHAWNLRAETFRRIGYYDDALLDLNRALQLEPNNAISYGIRGALFYKMKRFNESLEDLKYSLQLLPNNGFCLGFLGATLIKLGFNDDALSKFNEALEINPDDIFVLYKRAKLYHSLCLDNSGLIDINKVLSINPFNHKALLIRGKINSALLNIDSGSLSDINKSLEMMPNNVNALKIRARFYHETNRNEEALNDLDKALNLTSNDISIFQLRGEIYRSICCFEEAIDDFNQILKRDPHNIFALSYRGATKYDQVYY